MDEKTMVNDMLEEIKEKLACYQRAICETENIELRQTLKQLRDNMESFQYELFKASSSKGYYSSVLPATEKDLQKVRKELENL